MRAWIVLSVLCLGSPAWAQDTEAPAAPLNAPSAFSETVKTVVNALSPGYETLYNVWHVHDKGGEWFQGLSASLWNVKSHDLPIMSLRVGYAIDFKPYLSLRADLPGLSHRFVPATVRGIATQSYLEAFWKIVGRYGSVGVAGGYDFDNSMPIVGLTIGASVSF